jgi:hypothetical protein
MKRGAVIGWVILGTMLSLLAAGSAAIAAGESRNGGGGQAGFRELAWGTTEAQARASWPDLVFQRYSLPEGEPVPYRIYARENETKEIYGVGFDSVQYWFREGALRRVTAEYRSQVGPRTLESAAGSAFETAASAIRARLGKPVEERRSGTVEIERVDVWASGGLLVRLSYSVEPNDVALLALTVEKGTP